MYEDRTFDMIMSEMLSDFGEDVRTDEKSLAYNACAKCADKLEEVYGDMSELSDNMLPDTQDIAHLIRYAAERGVAYRYATAPIVRGVFVQEIEDGEAFTCNDYTYIVIGLIPETTYNYYLQCETEGTEANTNFGDLDPVDYIDDYAGGQITEVLTPGTDDEDEEVFRARVIDSFQSKAFGGNKADYRLYIDALTGVGGCKPKRRGESDLDPWIYITIVDSEYSTPSLTLIDEVQTAVDPEENHGEGDGMAPMCHYVMIQGAESVNIDIETMVTFDSGYDVGTSQQSIETAIEDYLAALRSGWEANGEDDMYVRIAQIEAKILTVEGVLDVANTTINGSASNAALNLTQIPVLGEVIINV